MSETKISDKLSLPKTDRQDYTEIFTEIDKKKIIKIPNFQREFIWNKEKTANLLDSILKGYPIGTFIFWETRYNMRTHKEIGGSKSESEGGLVKYVLDGQQRITSLYAVYKGLTIDRKNYKEIYIDLEINPDDNPIIVLEKPPHDNCISVHEALTEDIFDIEGRFTEKKFARKLNNYKNKLTKYEFPTITIEDYPIEIACEIFNRINTGGQKLTTFEIMVALTYQQAEGTKEEFDLAKKYEKLVDDDLTPANFETISGDSVLQCVATIIKSDVKEKEILKIKRDTFIENWEPTTISLGKSIDFIRSSLNVPTSRLLPYPAILILFTYFFNKTDNKRPSNEQIKLLEQFYYWVGINYRYSLAGNARIMEDFRKMDSIIKGDEPSYDKNELNLNTEQIKEFFQPNTAYTKAVLSLLASKTPENFNDSSKVIIDNSNLTRAYGRNFHHFFPKAYLNENQLEKEPNLLANITLISADYNRSIGGKRGPSEYIGELKNDKNLKYNPDLKQTLETHFIGDTKEFGIDDDDYDKFIDERAERIKEALEKKLNPF